MTIIDQRGKKENVLDQKKSSNFPRLYVLLGCIYVLYKHFHTKVFKDWINIHFHSISNESHDLLP